MAQLRDTLIQGSARVTDTLYANTINTSILNTDSLNTNENITLTSTSGDSPAIIFDRGSTNTDWKLLVTAGKLSFQSRTGTNTFTERGYFADNSGAFWASTHNGLTLTAASTGFTIAGGITSKTLTVSDTVSLSGGSNQHFAVYGTNNTISGSRTAYLIDESGSTVANKRNELVLGNSVASTSNGSAFGRLALYSQNTAGTYLVSASGTSWQTATLQAKTGIIAYTDDITTAIQELDSTLPTGSAASKTLTALTITDGKMTAATFSDISIGASQVSSGTLAIARGGTGLATADPHKILIGPSSGTAAAAPTWRTLAAADLPIATSSAVGGTSISTGLSITSAGALSVVYGTANGTALGTASAGSANSAARSDHVHPFPALTSCTGTLTVEKGGTNATTAAAARANLGTPPYIQGVFYGTCDTAQSTKAKQVILTNGEGFTLDTGVVVFVKFTHASAAATMTMAISADNGSTYCTAKNLYRYATTTMSSGVTTTGWRDGAMVCFVYDGTGWERIFWENSTYSYMRPYESTANGTTATKTGAAGWKFQLTAGKYFMYSHYYDNTYQGALTLNIGGTGAKPIYINGSPSSSTNYTLPGGQYLVYYDGTNYHFRTDGSMAGTIANFKVTTNTNLGIDAPGTNAIGYVSGLVRAPWNYQQTDGSLYTQFYNESWISEIFQDYRTGQLSVRGKNNGTWQSWRRILDETNGATILGLSNYRLNTQPTQGAWFAGTPVVGSDGVTEIGKYLDFHATNTGTSDYDIRIAAETTGLTSSSNLIVSNTSAEAKVQATSSAGQIYLFSQASTTGNRGIYTKNAANGEGYIISVDQNNYINHLADINCSLRHRNNTLMIRNSMANKGDTAGAAYIDFTDGTMTANTPAKRMGLIENSYDAGTGGGRNMLLIRAYKNTANSTDQTYLGIFYYNDGTKVAASSGQIRGAVWNDYAEYRASAVKEPGRVLTEDTDGIMKLANERLMPACKIYSDTFGVAIGETAKDNTPIAVSGRVLAYPYRNRNEYHLGDAVCSAPNGTIDIMTREEIMMYPERIIGTVSEIPDYEEWACNYGGHAGMSTEDNKPSYIKVNGRIWIYVR